MIDTERMHRSIVATAPVLLALMSPLRLASAFSPAPFFAHRFALTPPPPRTAPLFALPPELEHARDVFKYVTKDKPDDMIGPEELGDLLDNLGIDASDAESEALFKYLDSDGNGAIGLDEFLPWYSDTAEIALDSAKTFQSIITDRRTVHQFDKTPVDDSTLRRAVQCAIAAPNRSGSEPWRFIQLGPETVDKVAKLNKDMGGDEGSFTKWKSIPGWCVATFKRTEGDEDAELEDFKSTCCAVENLMLSMWSEGIGSKWTAGPVQKTPEFAALCGVDTESEKIAGVVWYGFASGGLGNVDPKRRQNEVEDVLTSLP